MCNKHFKIKLTIPLIFVFRIEFIKLVTVFRIEFEYSCAFKILHFTSSLGQKKDHTTVNQDELYSYVMTRSIIILCRLREDVEV